MTDTGRGGEIYRQSERKGEGGEREGRGGEGESKRQTKKRDRKR